MKTIQVKFLFENGKLMFEDKLRVFLIQPRLIQMDDKFFVMENETTYRQAFATKVVRK